MKSNSIRELKITIIGNEQVGKTTFIDQIQQQCKVSKSKINLSVDKRNCKFLALGEEYELSLVDVKGSGKHLEKGDNTEFLTNKTDICAIFFDVSNKQSFSDINHRWLTYTKKEIKPKNIVIVANKIDKQMTTITLKQIIQFGQMNDIQVFFCTSNMTQINDKYCRSVLEDIIIYHQSKLDMDEIRNKKEEDIKNTSFFSKIFTSNNQQKQKEKEKQREKLKELKIVRKMLEMKKVEKDMLINIQRKNDEKIEILRKLLFQYYQECFRESLITQHQSTTVTNSNVNGITLIQNKEEVFEIVMKQFKSKIQGLNKEKSDLLQVIRTQKYKYQQKLSLTIQKSKKKLKDYQQKYKKSQQLYNQKIYSLQKEIQSFKTQIQSLENQKIHSTILVDNNNKQIEKAKQLEKELAREALTNKEFKSQIDLLKQSMAEKQKQLAILARSNNQLLYVQTVLRNQPDYLLQKLTHLLHQYDGIKNFKLAKIYQSNLCYSANFHTYISQSHTKLLYILQFPLSNLVIYTPQSLMPMKKGKKAKIIVIKNPNTKQSNQTGQQSQIHELIDWQLNKSIDLWNYDPISLVFGLREIMIMFGTRKCAMWINPRVERKKSLFTGKIKEFISKLGVQFNQRGLADVNMLEIFSLESQ